MTKIIHAVKNVTKSQTFNLISLLNSTFENELSVSLV